MNRLFAVLLIGLAFCFIGPRIARAEVSQEKLLRAVLGEAEGEPYLGKVALAQAIHNRGSLVGVYGYKAISKRLGAYYRGSRRLSDNTVESTLKALKQAKTGPDLTKGSDHWENIKAFGVPYWAKGKTPAVVIGSHAFYNDIN